MALVTITRCAILRASIIAILTRRRLWITRRSLIWTRSVVSISGRRWRRSTTKSSHSWRRRGPSTRAGRRWGIIGCVVVAVFILRAIRLSIVLPISLVLVRLVATSIIKRVATSSITFQRDATMRPPRLGCFALGLLNITCVKSRWIEYNSSQ
jgi:hypothetical protein